MTRRGLNPTLLALMLAGLIITLMFSQAAAQDASPTVYLVAKDQYSVPIYWFETANDECYLYRQSISCLRK